ncbi:MAG: hypothetical protein ACR2NM_13985, partial [Bythopirellula sp.]
MRRSLEIFEFDATSIVTGSACEYNNVVSCTNNNSICNAVRAYHWRSLARACLLVIGLADSTCFANRFAARGTVFYFDAGPPDSLVDSRASALHSQLVYRPELGFGWTQKPTSDFLHKELSRSRSALTIDGVAGSRIAFRADVSPGEWGVTVWLDAASLAQTPLRLLTQGRTRELGWQRFTPPAEPRQTKSKTVRVFHSTTQVGSDGFSMQLIAEDREVRLLGISLVRKAEASSPEQQKFLALLNSAGSYGSRAELSGLKQQAAQAGEKNRADAFYAAWRERLALLIEAESLFDMRGWQWANEKTGLGMFDRLYQAVMWIDGLLGNEDLETNPLAERALFLRGRILYWLHRERGGDDERAGAIRDLSRLHARHPKDQLLAMYAGENMDQPDPCDDLEAPANAPAWSVAQREALCRMRQICHWWVQHQQAENGEFGGKLGDDVELLRWWAPLVLAGDKLALEGWRKLADGVWNSDLVREGYAAKVSDVEHAAEFIADTAPLMAIYSDDERYLQRLAPTSKHFESLWTGVTTRQHRFFRSAWYNSAQVDIEPPKDRDLEYNT